MVIACNTASTLVLPQLRARFPVPFIGTVPAIKPACAASVSKRVSVLGTEATISREYTRALIRDFANGADVTLVGSSRLAAMAEAELRGEPVSDDADGAGDRALLRRRRRPAHRHHRAGLHPLSAAARSARQRWRPGRCSFVDPAPAIARRVIELTGAGTGTEVCGCRGSCSPPAARPPPRLAAALAGFGLASRPAI